MKSPLKIGDIVHVVFLDHAENGDEMLFEVFGRLIGKSRRAYQVRSWGYVSDVDRAADTNSSDNENWYSIVRSTVQSLEVWPCAKPSKR